MAKKLIVFLGLTDWAGSCYFASQAVDSFGQFECRHITMLKHPYEYPYGLLIPVTGTNENPRDYPEYEKAMELINRADLIHIWNGETVDFQLNSPNGKPFEGGFPLPEEKVRSYTFTGGHYRRSHAVINNRARESGVKMIVQDPNFLQFGEMDNIDAEFIPHAVDTELLKPLPIEERQPFSIGCYNKPNVVYQQTIRLLASAIAENRPWKITMDEIMSWKERMKVLPRCMFFFQSLNTVAGIYGRSALESCSMGIPTFSYISERSRELSGGRIGDPAIIHVSPLTIKDVIRETLNSDYETLSKKAREWVIKYHGYQTIGERYSKVFENLLVSGSSTKLTLKANEENQILAETKDKETALT